MGDRFYAQQRQKRGYAGVTKLRKTLRRLEPEATEGLKAIVYESVQRLESLVAMNAPVGPTGDLKKHVGQKISSDGFTAVVGVGAGNAHIRSKGFGAVKVKKKKNGEETKVTIRNKAARWNMYKALWHEFGTKGTTSRKIKQRFGGSRVKRGVPPQPASHFHQRSYDSAAPWIRRNSALELKQIVKKASNG